MQAETRQCHHCEGGAKGLQELQALGLQFIFLLRDFPAGLVVESPLCNAGDTGLIPAQGTKIPHAEQ